MRSTFNTILRATCCLALIVGVATADDGDKPTGKGKQAQEKKIIRKKGIVIEQPTRRVRIRVEGAQASRFWIGVQLAPIPKELRTKYKLDEGVGLLVAEVVLDSPAAKSDLKQGDVLLAVGDRVIKSHETLAKAITAAGAKKKPVKLIVMRDGKKTAVKVTPTAAPVQFQLDIDNDGDPDLILRLRGVLPFGPDGKQPRTDNRGQGGNTSLRIEIRRDDGKPAVINVTRDGRQWKVSEKELDKLPKDVRAAVKSALERGGPNTIVLQRQRSETTVRVLPRRSPQKARVKPINPARSTRDLERKLDRVLKELKALRKAVEELKRQQGSGKNQARLRPGLRPDSAGRVRPTASPVQPRPIPA